MTYSNTLPNGACAPARLAAPQNGPLASLRALLTLRRSRAALARLSASQLEDIGLSAAQARLEATRAVWDVPVHWTNKR